jgi:hypothetical protein
MEFQTLVDTLSAFGLPGLLAALVILIGVFVARQSGLVATGNQARIANIVLSAVLFGLGDNPQAEGALMAVLSSLLAALAFTGLEWLNKNTIAKG